MLKIEAYMMDHYDEGFIVKLSVEMDSVGDFVASIVDEEGKTLLDRQGERTMSATGSTLDEAMAKLDELAGR